VLAFTVTSRCRHRLSLDEHAAGCDLGPAHTCRGRQPRPDVETEAYLHAGILPHPNQRGAAGW